MSDWPSRCPTGSNQRHPPFLAPGCTRLRRISHRTTLKTKNTGTNKHKDKDSNKPNIEIEINDKDTNNNKAKTADYNKIHEVRRGRTGGKREGRRREGEGGGEGGRGGAEEAEGGVGEDREEKPDTEARN